MTFKEVETLNLQKGDWCTVKFKGSKEKKYLEFRGGNLPAKLHFQEDNFHRDIYESWSNKIESIIKH